MSTLELDRLATHWQWALDSADRALHAAHDLPSPVACPPHPHEREATVDLLREVAAERPGSPRPWLAPVAVTPRLLGLPAGARACLFDLDGVLTDSGVLHAWAWQRTLDDFLIVRSSTGIEFAPFDPAVDYGPYLDGRPRLEGLRAFLASRGVSVDDGTAATLAHRKGELVAVGMRRRGVTALPGARRYLVAAGHAHLGRAVVSASTSTRPMLELAQLATLVDARVDADAMREQALRARPAPDLLVAACKRLGVEPQHAVTLTHSSAGVEAGLTAGLTVIAVGPGEDKQTLASLLDPRLRSG